MLKPRQLALVLVPLTLLGQFAYGLTTTLTETGIVIDAGEGGQYTLAYPALGVATQSQLPSHVTVQGRKFTAEYANGAALATELRVDGTMSFHFTALPEDVKNLRFDLPLPLALNRGGSFAIDHQKPITFPATAGTDAFLFKGNAKRLVVTPPKGDAFAIDIEHGWQQVQDNRVWNTDTFGWMASAELPRVNGTESYYTIRIAAPNAAAATNAAPALRPRGESLAVKLGDKAISITAGTAGSFSLSYPSLVAQGDKLTGPAQIAKDAEGVALIYAGGAKGHVKLDKSTLTISFSGLPAEAKQFRMEMLIPINFAGKGTYAIGGAAAQTFPAQKPASAFLYQGNVDRIQIVHPTGPGFSIGVPPYSYQQLQDNRQWNWNTFDWWFASPMPEGNASPEFTVRIAPAGAAGQSEPIVDRYGQWVKVDFPAKVKSDAELKEDAARETRWLASLKPPVTDPYGGLPGSGEKFGLKKTGFFHLGRIAKAGGGSADVLVTPDGNAFFQLGMCGISPCDDYTTVRGRESIYQWLPSSDQDFLSARREGDSGVVSFYLANTIRKYGQPYELEAYFSRWIDRLRAWGFNSAGAFNAVPAVVQQKRFPYVAFVPTPAPKLGELGVVWDPFAPNLEAKFDAAFAAAVAPKANDPMLIGYFISNEPLLEDVPKVVPSLRASKCPAKARLVAMLKEKYQTVVAFNTAWNGTLASFDAAAEQPLLVVTRAAADDMAAFFKLFLETRYGLVARSLRKYDPNHLLIGDRWMPGTANSELLVTTAAKYLDVVSVNYYTYGIDKAFLDRIHGWAQKPLLFSEFYYAVTDQGLQGGNKVNSQTERGLAYRNYVEQSAATGYVVGIQWFLALDQAATGRFFEGFNGEAANTGLVNVADRPYRDFLAEAMKTNYTIYDLILGRRRPFAFDDPRFAAKRAGAAKSVAISRMVNQFVLDGSRARWPSVPPARIGADGLVQGRDAQGLEATFRLAWDDANLYLFVEVSDPTPMKNSQKPQNIWNGDAIELFIGHEDLDQGGSLKYSDRQILIRGAKTDGPDVYFGNAPKQVPARSIVLPGLDGKGYTLEAAIPWEGLGFVPKAGQEILFDLGVDDSETGNGRIRQIVFNGNARNSKDRGVWGRATFVK
jgi:hypothetical protein